MDPYGYVVDGTDCDKSLRRFAFEKVGDVIMALWDGVGSGGERSGYFLLSVRFQVWRM